MFIRLILGLKRFIAQALASVLVSFSIHDVVNTGFHIFIFLENETTLIHNYKTSIICVIINCVWKTDWISGDETTASRNKIKLLC